MNAALTETVKVEVLSQAVTTGTTDHDSSASTLDGYDSIALVVVTGSAASDIIPKALGSTDNSTFAVITSSAVTVDGTGKVYIIDMPNVDPNKVRYVKARVVRTTTTTVPIILAIKYNARSLPCSSAVAGTLLVNLLLAGTTP